MIRFLIMVALATVNLNQAHAGNDEWEKLMQSLKLPEELQPGWDKWEACEKAAQQESIKCWQAANAADIDNAKWLAEKQKCRARELEKRAACQTEWESFKKAVQNKKQASTKKRADDSWIKEKKETPSKVEKENVPDGRPMAKRKRDWEDKIALSKATQAAETCGPAVAFKGKVGDCGACYDSYMKLEKTLEARARALQEELREDKSAEKQIEFDEAYKKYMTVYQESLSWEQACKKIKLSK